MKNNHPKIIRIFTAWACAVLAITFGTVPALAAADPLTVVNNLSDFIFSAIRAIGIIILDGASSRSVCPSSPTTQASAPRAFCVCSAAS